MDSDGFIIDWNETMIVFFMTIREGHFVHRVSLSL